MLKARSALYNLAFYLNLDVLVIRARDNRPAIPACVIRLVLCIHIMLR